MPIDRPGAGAPARGAVRGVELERARNGGLGGVFDHVAIAVSDLAASERFYRTVLSVLGVEPSHADAELVEWEDWDIAPTDREHAVTRGLHVGFRAPTREAVDAFWQAGIDAGFRDDGAPGRARSTDPTTTAASCSTRTATAPRPCTASGRARCPPAASTCGVKKLDSGCEVGCWSFGCGDAARLKIPGSGPSRSGSWLARRLGADRRLLCRPSKNSGAVTCAPSCSRSVASVRSMRWR